jgi:hypothetical protein
MFTGPNAPHLPTVKICVLLLLVALAAYHFCCHRKVTDD